MNPKDGFSIANIDVGLMHDQKVVALARRLHDERLTAASIALYLSLVLESWAAGDRVTLDEGLPAWWLDELDGIRGDLQAVGLIDDESRIPPDAWTSWFVTAFDRREKSREGGAEGGRRSWQSRRDKRRRSPASAEVQPTSSPPSAGPNLSVPPSGRPTGLQDGAENCPLCGRAISASDKTRVRRVDGKYVTAHDECPVDDDLPAGARPHQAGAN